MAKDNVKKQKKGSGFDFNKMLLLFALVPLIVSIVCITFIFIFKSKAEVENLAHNYMLSMAISEGEGLESEIANRGATFALGNEGLTDYCDDIKLEDISSSYAYVADATGTMLWHPTAEKIGQPVTNETIQGVCADMAAGTRDDANVVTYIFKGEKKYAAYYVAENLDFVFVISADNADVMSGVNSLIKIGNILSFAFIIIFAIAALVLAKKFSKPLKDVVAALGATAEGNLNADTDIKASIRETKDLVASAKTLQNVLQKTIGDTQNISYTLKDGAENVAELAQRSKEGSDQISQAMEDLAQGATSMAESVQSISEQILQMGTAIDGISANADQLVVLSNDIKSANDVATEYIGKVAGSSEKSVSAVSAISQQINATNDSVGQIRDAADMIGSIANQTNLLALNASIEAARAGEAGRGFAVVAEEIKNLSEQSNASADEIRQIVKNIIAQSEKSVTLAANVADIISEEQGYIDETGKKFDTLAQEINESLEEIGNISAKVSHLNETKNAITSSVEDLSAISEENAASNQEVSASVSEIANSISSIANNSESTNEMAVNLTDTVSYFK